jgi:predicted ATPase/class 3 adenylate cyclase
MASEASSLPAGTVTFLFTDIEGSTKLLKKLGDQYASLLAEHRQILREIFTRWHGQDVDVQGDSCFFTFPRAKDAVAAAVEAQKSLVEHMWPGGVHVRVRMGLHTGEPWLVEEGYVGMAVHRAARIGDAGHGGQVLLSETVEALVRDELPEGVSLLDLGRHRLKDMNRSECIHQLVINDLFSHFPPISSLDSDLPPVPPNNLPVAVTPFIGRRQELESLKTILSDPGARQVTILGGGGMGKTRLALATAEQQLITTRQDNGTRVSIYPDGIYFVPLAPLTSPEGILTSIASSVGFQFSRDIDPETQLLSYLHDKRMLLILDNFEHLLEGSVLLKKILENTTDVNLIITSREKLWLRGEIVFPLKGMAVPENKSKSISNVEETMKQLIELRSYSAIRLFEECAKRVDLKFILDVENLDGVVRTCQLVDGMPLAIEMATTWLDTLSPKEIAMEIEGGFDLLKRDFRDGEKRHQSVRIVLDHTWDRLDKAEREIFCRFSVFHGSFNREAVQNVTGASLADLQRLLSKSLIQRGQGSRYEVHELLRQYGQEMANKLIDQKQNHHRYLEYYLSLLSDNEADIRAGRQGRYLIDIANFREAFKTAVQYGFAEEIILSHQSLFWIYEIQGWFVDGAELFQWCLDRIKGKILNTDMKMVEGMLFSMLGRMKYLQGEQVEGTKHMQLGSEILENCPQRVEALFCKNLWLLSLKTKEYSYIELCKCFENVLELFRDEKQAWGEAITQNLWGQTALERGVLDDAKTHLEEALRLNKQINDTRGIAWSLGSLGTLAHLKSNLDEAKQLYEESLAAHKLVGYSYLVALMYRALGDVCVELEQIEEGMEFYNQALEIYIKTNSRSSAALTRIIIANALILVNDIKASALYLEQAYVGINESVDAFLFVYFVLVLARWLSKFGEIDQSFNLVAWIMQHPSWNKGFADFVELLLAEFEQEKSKNEVEQLRMGKIMIKSTSIFSEAKDKLMNCLKAGGLETRPVHEIQ